MQTTQKYIPTEHSREKNTFLEEFFSGPDVEITMNNMEIPYINAIQFSINEQLKPIYGYQSRTYDNMAVGTRLVTGVIKVPVKNNNSNELEDYKRPVATLLTEEEVKKKKPSWILDSSILADVYRSKDIPNKIKKGKIVVDSFLFLDPDLKKRIDRYDKDTNIEILNETNNSYLVKNDSVAGFIDKRCIRVYKEE